MWKNKKILLLCKETFSYPLYFLAQKWKHENEVAAFFFMPTESKYEATLLNSTTYFAYKKMDGVKIYDAADIADDFTHNIKKPPVDEDYLQKLEDKYANFKCFNNQVITSQFLTRQYHFRNYMKMFTHEQLMYWLSLNYKRVIEILEEFKPDVIIDYDDSELPREIVNEVAYVKKIPYITIEHPRYENYKLYTFQMGLGIDPYFAAEYKNNFNRIIEELETEIEYINDFRKKQSIMPSEFKNTITAKYEKDKLGSTLKLLLGKIVYFYKQDRTGNNKKIKKMNPLLYPNSWEYLKFYFRVEFQKRKLYGRNKYFENPVAGEKYIYMPLHLIPESTTFVKAPFYINELTIIEAVSKSLPIGWKLYVKEHQSMLGERGLDFYKMVKKFPNVRLVSVNYYKDPKPWLQLAQGVITITGTSAYEAALLGKQSIIFGDVPFSLIEGIHRIHSFEELPKLLRSLPEQIDNQKSCAAYIRAVKEVGSDFSYRYLLQEGENIMFQRSAAGEKFEQAINELESFYFNAYQKYQSWHGKPL